MITEIKIRKNKFGTIISSLVDGANTAEDAANLESMNAFAAFVTIHTKGVGSTRANGITYVAHKNLPKLKQAVGHHISQIRGEQVFAFVLPSTKFLDDIAKVYQFAEANRMERAYGFYLGEPDRPSVVAFSGMMAEHLFHAVPDQLDMTGDAWLQWIHKWAPKAMMPHRYFDANQYCAIATMKGYEPESIEPSPGYAKPAGEYAIVDVPIPVAYKAPEPEALVTTHIPSDEPVEAKETAKTEVLKRKRGRPKKK